MPEQTVTFTVCSTCGGVIPDKVPQISGVQGRLINPDGSAHDFNGLDFCCTEHMSAFLAQLPNVPTPSPAYQPPTGNVT